MGNFKYKTETGPTADSFSISGKGPEGRIVLSNQPKQEAPPPMEATPETSSEPAKSEPVEPRAEADAVKELTPEEVCRLFLVVLEKSPYQISEELRVAMADYISEHPGFFTRTRLFKILYNTIPLAQSGERRWNEEEWKDFHQENRDLFLFLDKLVQDYLAAQGQIAIQDPRGKHLILREANEKPAGNRGFLKKGVLRFLGYRGEEEMREQMSEEYKRLLEEYETLQLAVEASKAEAKAIIALANTQATDIAQQNRNMMGEAANRASEIMKEATQQVTNMNDGIAKKKRELDLMRKELLELEAAKLEYEKNPGIVEVYRHNSEVLSRELYNSAIDNFASVLEKLKPFVQPKSIINLEQIGYKFIDILEEFCAKVLVNCKELENLISRDARRKLGKELREMLDKSSVRVYKSSSFAYTECIIGANLEEFTLSNLELNKKYYRELTIYSLYLGKFITDIIDYLAEHRHEFGEKTIQNFQDDIKTFLSYCTYTSMPQPQKNTFISQYIFVGKIQVNFTADDIKQWSEAVDKLKKDKLKK